MKNIVIKIHNNSKTIATHNLDINDKKPLIIQAKPHLNYEFLDTEIGVSPNHIVTKRGGSDLGILLNNEVKDAGIVIIKDFYKYSDNALIGKAESNQYYYYIPDSGEVGDYVTQLANNKSSGLALGGDGFNSPWWVDSSNVKTARSLKSILKSIISDEPSIHESSAKATQVTDPTDLIKIVSPKVKTSQATDPTDLIKIIEPKAKISQTTEPTSFEDKNDGFLDNLDVSPWLIGAGVGLGTLAIFAGGGSDNNDDNSSKDKTDSTIKGTENNDILNGSAKNDAINGLAGNDKLNGKEGNDKLVGGDGFDILHGGKGSDTLTGGNDSDTFVFKLSDFTDKSVDTITDFIPTIDKIQLPKELFKSDKVADNLTDYIKYDEETGELSYDSDGKGGAESVIFAILSNNAELIIDNDTFQII